MFKKLWLVIFISVISQLNAIEIKSERTLIIMRHGQGEHNIGKFYNSNPDNPLYHPVSLTTEGINQVKTTAKTLLEINFKEIRAVFTSPLPRTKQTANILSKSGLFEIEKIVIDPRLIEVSAGDREGRFHSDYPNNTNTWNLTNAHDYGGENRKDLRRRLQSFLTDIQQNYPKGNVLIITHGTPAREIINLITNKDEKLPTAGFKYLNFNLPIEN